MNLPAAMHSMPADPLRVLVVDDQTSIRMVLRAELEAAGHEVVEAADGRQAISAYIAHRPDIVLLDVEMPPPEDGYAVARRMRSLDPDDWIPIIFVTSHDSDEDFMRGIEAGGDAYLIKPVRVMVLRAKMVAMMRLKQMRQKLMSLHAELGEANRQLLELSRRDALTGLLNRRAFDERLSQDLHDALRTRVPMTLILVDVDHFKKYNDQLGHIEGDACLRRVGALLQGVCRRPRDAVARYGGEEFALLLPGTPKTGAMIFARALVRAVEVAAIPHPASTTAAHVTISGGVATFDPTSRDAITPQEFTALADAALYEAKATGRNRLFSHDLSRDTAALRSLDPSASLAA